jgi:diadenylate cyclase
MSETINVFVSQLSYLFAHITLINVIDILLVTGFFFVIFQALYQTRALQLLRGAIIIAILGVSIFFLLPLETFSLLVLGLLIAGAIALPILFQDELRRALTGLGQIGTRRGNGSAYDQLKSALMTASQQLSSRRFGALIVLEGQTPLDDIIETGIPTQAEQVSPELLTTIFYPNTALHDGAVVLRGDRLMAAGCILPMQKEQTETEHLGTRHRAALGLTFQVPDALVIVISEETGNISVSQGGRLDRGLTQEELEDKLDHFQHQVESQPQIRWIWLRSGGPKVIITNLLVALILALVAWVSVMFQTNPPQLIGIADVPLIVIPASSDLILTSELPDTVVMGVQTTQDIASELDRGSVTAEVDLSDLPAGVHQVPVEVNLANERVQLRSVTPSSVNVTLEAITSEKLAPNPVILDPGSLPVGYSLGTISTSPETVLVQGQESLVSQVVQARIVIQLNERRDDFQQVVPVSLLDQDGKVVEGLIPSPQQVLANITIEQDFFTRDAPVQAVLDTDTLDSNYEITSIEVLPSSITLTGDRTALAGVGEFVETAPINLTDVYSELTVDAPLILPVGVTALNEEGEIILTVNVRIILEPITDYLALTRFVEERGLGSTMIARLTESRVSVLLFGPRSLLDEIIKDPNLVTVFVDLDGLAAGTYTLPIGYEAPQDVIVELFPSETEAVIVEKP